MIETENSNPGGKFQKRTIIILLSILLLSILVFFISGELDLLERLYEFSQEHEDFEIDEMIVVAIFLFFAFTAFALYMWAEARRQRDVAVKSNIALQKALSEIRELKGILPICASCKKIRDDKGYWHQVESYIRDHSDAEFSHSICPECMAELYPEFHKEEE